MKIRKPLSLLLISGALAFGAHGSFAFEPLSLAQTSQPSSLHMTVSEDQKLIDGAKKFVGGMSNRAIGFLSNDKLSEIQKTGEFRKLLRSSFDVPTIARFSLGRYWRVATKPEQKEYLRLFEKMIINVYSNRFGEYKGQDLQVRAARQKGKKDVIVSTFIVPDSGPEIQVDWRVRLKNGRYKVVDVIVEGVSMAVTQRSDFSSVIQRGGGKVGVLLVHLRQDQIARN